MHLLPPPLRLEWDHYARHLPRPQPGHDRLLDVGCGNGGFLARARQAGWKVYGTDFDPEAASIARAQDIDVWVGDYREASFEEESFDLVTTHQVIEHVYLPHDFIRSIHRWLKPGGMMWLGTPNLECRIHTRFGRYYENLHPPQHLQVFSINAICELIEEAGFAYIKTLRRGFFEYHQTIGSIAISQGLSGRDVFKGLIHPSILERCLCFSYELLSWLDPARGSDIVITAYKP